MIKINYDVNGIPIVSILTLGGYAVVPWDYERNVPDWEQIDYEPRRNNIKQQWENYVESYHPVLNPESENYLFKIRIDFAAIPETIEEIPPPQWENFNFYLLTHPAFVAYGLGTSSANPFLVPGIVERYGKVADIGVAGSGFGAYWNYFCQALEVTVEHRNEWANKAVEFNLPADFVEVVGGNNHESS